jgi:lipopolysaccharide transport system permease protein
VFLPCFILLTFITSMGFGLFFAVLNVRFRDIGQLIPFMVQVGMYACPVAYSSTLAQGTWFEKYYSLYSTAAISLIILIVSLIYFRKKENTFVDHI